MLDTNVRLAEATANLLKERKLSLRATESLTGVSYNVVLNMRSGKRPGYESILRFARGMNVDPLDWLDLAGYTDIVELARPNKLKAETDGSTHLRSVVFPQMLDALAPLPYDALRHYVIALRAFTRAWITGWRELHEEYSGIRAQES